MMSTSPDLLRLVYVSRSLVPPAETESAVLAILGASRRRNPATGVTGALLFSNDCFAQSLEGPMAAVEALFEHIQMDTRHDQVVLLEAGPVSRRDFGDWSMGFAGHRTEAALCFEALVATPSESSRRVLDVLRGAVGRATPALA